MERPTANEQDEVDARYFRVIEKLNDLREDFSDLNLENFPKFLICGVESVGKTTLLEAIAGVPLGFKQEGTATRCPVEYTLIKHQGKVTDPEVGFTKDYEQVKRPLGELTAEIQEHMQKIHDSNEFFSAKVLRVRIVHPDLKRNMIFLDSPGLKPSSADFKTLLEDVVKSLVAQRQYSIIVVFKHMEKRENDTAFPYVNELFSPVRPGWVSEKSTIFVLNQLNNGIGAHFGSTATLQAELDRMKHTLPTQYTFNLALRIKGSPYDQACDDGPQQLEQEIAALKTIEDSEIQWLASLPTLEAYRGLQVPAEFTNSFGVKNLVKCIHRSWRSFVDDNAKKLMSDLTKRAAAESVKLKALVEDLEERKEGTNSVGPNITTYISLFLDAFEQMIRGDIKCKNLEMEYHPEDFIDLSDPHIFEAEVDKDLSSHLSHVQWSRWRAFRDITSQGLPSNAKFKEAAPLPPKRAHPSSTSSEVVPTRKPPKAEVIADGAFPSVALQQGKGARVFVSFEDLKPHSSYTVWFRSEGDAEWSALPKALERKSCVKDIDPRATLWVFVELNGTNMRSKTTRFDPIKDVAVHDLEEDKKALLGADLNIINKRGEADGSKGPSVQVPEPPPPALPSLSAEMEGWKKMFGENNWTYRAGLAHGAPAIERLISSYALVLYRLPSTSTDVSYLTRVVSQQGDGNAAEVVQHCVQALISDATGGASLVAQSMSCILEEYPPIVFRYLSGTKTHHSMQDYVESVQELIRVELNDIIETTAKRVLNFWQVRVFGSLGNGWKINFLDPIVMATCTSDFRLNIPKTISVAELEEAQTMNEVNAPPLLVSNRTEHPQQVRALPQNSAAVEEINKSLDEKLKMLRWFGNICAGVGTDPRRRFDPVDMAFPCVLRPANFHQESLRQAPTIARLQNQAKEEFWHVLNVALPVLRAQVNDEFMSALNKSTLLTHLTNATARRNSQEGNSTFVERLVKAQTSSTRINQLEQEIAEKKRVYAQLAAAKDALEQFFMSS